MSQMSRDGALPLLRGGPGDLLRALGERALRLPLFYKILIANTLLVAAGAVIGTTLSFRAGHQLSGEAYYRWRYAYILLFATGGTALSALIYSLLVRWALRPLEQLQEAAEAIRRGQFNVRVPPHPFRDAQMEQLVETFNQMVETIVSNSERLHWLSQQILQAQEEERARIARELHDEAAQWLTSLLIRQRLLLRSLPPEMRPEVEELQRMTTAALEHLRRIAMELRPAILDDLGLVEALRWQAEEFQKQTGLSLTLQIQGRIERLPRQVELVLYRVAQEALTNIARHARATRVEITLNCSTEHLELLIADDGVGFDPEAVRRSRARSLGLIGMAERLALIGGTLEIDSAPGKGTRIRARVPAGGPHCLAREVWHDERRTEDPHPDRG
ncbi:two-component system, NarL family, sensor histidine kinase UhpB [Thermoflexus hugenholtzii JAD2]|jgi:Signal transduction histidine kinase|uniref:histidine kinase n=2 Tax=Thermoflexus TaxID=1495649 RepID=A0A212RCE3_9CHLR|nr:two-component system, NarL family, sensor histidine kinase UhpB [Thermoflexus hugenholtzii JAD2]